ncbi:AbrB family transcriptional regulator [Infirmifilum sp. SLHALR2]
MAIVVEVNSKGRVYLPVSVRRAVPFKRFIVRVEGERIVLVPIKVGEHYGAAKPAAYDTAEQIDGAAVRETERVLREDVR